MKVAEDIIISRDKAAEILLISTATVRNWEKSGLLISDNGLLRLSQVKNILRLIKNGELKRLTKRANKRGGYSNSVNIPDEGGKALKDMSGDKYQNSKSVALRSKEGSFYTPEFIIDEIVAEYISPGKSVYDPCCEREGS